MGKLFSFFMASYAQAGNIERKQIRALLTTLFSVLGGALVISLALKDAQAISTALLVLAAIALVLLCLVKAGFVYAVSFATSGLLCLLLAAIPFIQRYRGEYEIYLIAATQGLVLILTGLIARKRWQTLPVLGAAAVAVVADYALRVMPANGGTLAHVSDPVTALVILLLITFVEKSISERSDAALAAAEEAAARAQAQVARLEKAIVSGEDAIHFGSIVTSSAERTAGQIARLRGTLDEVASEVGSLAANSQVIRQSHEAIAASQAEVLAKVADQSSIVTESSAAIEQMTASVNSISAIAQTRGKAIGKLKEATALGASEMSRSAQAVKAMEESAASIGEVVQVIRRVASKTNLLAMNAAIEAAHAGDAGKGFAVVAGEIRGLSEETSKNVKIIDASVKGTLESSRTAAEVNAGAYEIFQRIDAEADEVAKAMEEIGRGLGEIESGSGEILQGVSQSVQITTAVRDASSAMGDTIGQAAESLGRLDQATKSVEESLSRAVGGFDEMRTEAEGLSEAGKRNETGLRELSDALRDVKA
jgi:methyl-accepting chemotaxis protein